MSVKWPMMQMSFEGYLQALFKDDSPLAGHEFGREILRTTFMAGARAALTLAVDRETRRGVFVEIGEFGKYINGEAEKEKTQ